MATSVGTGSSGTRIVGLDGLRGIAAVVVVVHHTLLLTPALIKPYEDPRGNSSFSIAAAFTYTPLHLAWDGPAAVFVFFVLSGLVLMLPLRHSPRNWAAYYPARMLRLYLPVWAAVALALLWDVAVPKMQLGSSWVQGHGLLTTTGVLKDLLLVVGAPGVTNSALWSLRWEATFSLALPGFVAFALLFRHLVILKIAILCTVMTLAARFGPVDAPYALSFGFQLPIFALGCLVAIEWDRLKSFSDRAFAGAARTVASAVLAGVLLSGYWIVCGLSLGHNPTWLLALSRTGQVLGATLLVILCGAVPQWGAVLSSPVPHWLGSRSFSLYLVHEPLVTAVGHLLPLPMYPFVSLAIAMPASLLLAEGFFRVIERPSHRLSRWTAARTRERQRARVALAGESRPG